MFSRFCYLYIPIKHTFPDVLGNPQEPYDPSLAGGNRRKRVNHQLLTTMSQYFSESAVVLLYGKDIRWHTLHMCILVSIRA